MTGDRFRVTARSWNAVMDAARKAREATAQGAGADRVIPPGIIRVLNTSGGAVDKFAVLGITGIAILPTESEEEFSSATVFNGVTPGTGTHECMWVITTEPIPNNTIGLAVADGISQAHISVTSAAHQFADIKNGDLTMLLSKAAGGARILWKESGTGTKWAIVRIGDSASDLIESLNYTAIDVASNTYSLDFAGGYLDTRMYAPGMNGFHQFLGDYGAAVYDGAWFSSIKVDTALVVRRLIGFNATANAILVGDGQHDTWWMGQYGDAPRMKIAEAYQASPRKSESVLHVQGYAPSSGANEPSKLRLFELRQSKYLDIYLDHVSGESGSDAVFGHTGTEFLRYDSSADALVANYQKANIDFRVASDTDDNTFVVDAGNNRIGLFTAAPSYPFHLSLAYQDRLTVGLHNTHETDGSMVLEMKAVGRADTNGVCAIHFLRSSDLDGYNIIQTQAENDFVIQELDNAASSTEMCRYDRDSANSFKWTGLGSYIPRYVDYAAVDFAALTCDAAWHDLDLSAIVPVGAKSVFLRVQVTDDAAGSYIVFRRNGRSNTVSELSCLSQVANIQNQANGFVDCDANRIVEYAATNTTFTTLTVLVLGWAI